MGSFFEKLTKDTPMENSKKIIVQEEEKKEWSALNEKAEGQLTIDVYQTATEFVVQSAIAGIKAGDLDISIENDVLTIKGVRENPNKGEEEKYFYQECYWGPFSRQIILPEEADFSKSKASIKDGVLILKIPRTNRETKKKITVEMEK